MKVGTRVETVKPVDNFPTIYLDVGAKGTLVRIDSEGAYWVQLDLYHPELKEWDNQVQIWDWSEEDERESASSYLKEI